LLCGSNRFPDFYVFGTLGGAHLLHVGPVAVQHRAGLRRGCRGGVLRRLDLAQVVRQVANGLKLARLRLQCAQLVGQTLELGCCLAARTGQVFYVVAQLANRLGVGRGDL